jgi:hypothetical protein
MEACFQKEVLLVHVSPRSCVCVCVETIRVVPTLRLADVHFNEVSEALEITQLHVVALMIPRLNTYSQPS